MKQALEIKKSNSSWNVLRTTLIFTSIFSLNALAKPATTIKIQEKVNFKSEGFTPFFVKGELTADAPFKGNAGVGLYGGHMGKFIFVDFGFNFQKTTYGAMKVYHTGLEHPAVEFDPNNEVGRQRSDTASGTMLNLGPGIGFIHKFFKSDYFTQTGRFGLSYSQWNDVPNGLTFRGIMSQFSFGVGFQLDRIMISPSLSYNLGYLKRPEIIRDGDYDRELPSLSYLPLQWWSWNVNVFFWL